MWDNKWTLEEKLIDKKANTSVLFRPVDKTNLLPEETADVCWKAESDNKPDTEDKSPKDNIKPNNIRKNMNL